MLAMVPRLLRAKAPQVAWRRAAELAATEAEALAESRCMLSRQGAPGSRESSRAGDLGAERKYGLGDRAKDPFLRSLLAVRIR